MDDVLNSEDPEEWLSETKRSRFERFRSDEVVGDHCESCQYDPDPIIKRGSLDADLLVVGSFPAARDFDAGEPFSGEAGELLRKMLEAIDCSWETDCYLTNALLCGGPEDRPGNNSVDACRINVHRQVGLVAPDVVLGLGKYAYCSLYDEPVDVEFEDQLGTQGPLPDLPWLEGVVTLHPELIRQKDGEAKQKLKRLAWKHLQQVKDLLESDPNPDSDETDDEEDEKKDSNK